MAEALRPRLNHSAGVTEVLIFTNPFFLKLPGVFFHSQNITPLLLLMGTKQTLGSVSL